jgi:hypothetical protein
LTLQVRLIKDPDAKSTWKTKISGVDEQLAAARRNLTMKVGMKLVRLKINLRI